MAKAISGRRFETALNVVLIGTGIVAVVLVLYSVHEARHIHYCNEVDSDPCYASWTFPWLAIQIFGFAVAGIVAAAVTLLNRRRDHWVARFVWPAVVVGLGVTLAVIVCLGARDGRSITPFDDPYHSMQTMFLALAGQAALIFGILGGRRVRRVDPSGQQALHPRVP